MKIKTSIMLVAAMSVIEPCVAATWFNVTGKVSQIRTSWEPDKACIVLDTGDIAKIDLTTEMGKAELSMALSAQLGNKDLTIKFDSDGVLEGFCDTGTNIKPHGMITIKQ